MLASMQLAGWKLRDIMEELHLDQGAAGRRYHVNQSTIGRWMSGAPIKDAATRQRIDREYLEIFGQDARPENPLPALMTRQLLALSIEDQYLVLNAFDAILACKV